MYSYRLELAEMNDEELLAEFNRIVEYRGEDLDGDYSEYFEALGKQAEMRGIKLPELPEYEEVLTPGSKALNWVKYYFASHVLEFQYKSGGDPYTLERVPKSKFDEFKGASSKGSFIAKLKKSLKQN
jgi:hypothetical protein